MPGTAPNFDMGDKMKIRRALVFERKIPYLPGKRMHLELEAMCQELGIDRFRDLGVIQSYYVDEVTIGMETRSLWMSKSMIDSSHNPLACRSSIANSWINAWLESIANEPQHGG